MTSQESQEMIKRAEAQDVKKIKKIQIWSIANDHIGIGLQGDILEATNKKMIEKDQESGEILKVTLKVMMRKETIDTDMVTKEE